MKTEEPFNRSPTHRITRARPTDQEHRIQCACIRWFRLQYPEHAFALFAIPNGGRRDSVTGARLKAEGVVAGVADLILLKPNGAHQREAATHGALCIEMKTSSGVQSAAQKRWQHIIEAEGARYVVCRSLEDFQRAIKEYI